MTQRHPINLPRSFGAGAAALIAMKAAVSAIVQRRQGASEPARLLYYRSHSLLRALRNHLDSLAA